MCASSWVITRRSHPSFPPNSSPPVGATTRMPTSGYGSGDAKPLGSSSTSESTICTRGTRTP